MCKYHYRIMEYNAGSTPLYSVQRRRVRALWRTRWEPVDYASHDTLLHAIQALAHHYHYSASDAGECVYAVGQQ